MSDKKASSEDITAGLSKPPINLETDEIKRGRGKDLKPRTRSRKPFLKEMKEEEVIKSFRMTKDMLEDIEEIARKERLRSFTSTMQFLLEIGINSYHRDDKDEF